MARRLLVLTLLVLAPSLAAAQSGYVDIEKRLTPEQLHATGLDTLSSSQRALLNCLLREEAGAAATPGSNAGIPARSASMTIGVEAGPVHSRVVGSLAGWEPGTVFVLENGQKWKVLKGRYRLRAPVQSPEADIVPGLSGRWFFKLDDDTPGPRVYRIE